MRRTSSTGWPPPDGAGDSTDSAEPGRSPAPLRPTSRFSNRADAYVRARPAYPAAFFDLLVELGLEEDHVVADVGSGTGILTGQLLQRGYRVLAVEPNPRMRGHAESELGSDARFESVAGSAEATSLPSGSADMAVVAQAFHWFDPGPTSSEFARILKRDRLAVIVWNIARPGRNEFTDAYLKLIARWGLDYQAVGARHADPGLLRAFFRDGHYEQRSLENAQHLDLEGWRARIESSSYMPSSGQAGYDDMCRDVDALFDAHRREGQVTILYETPVFWGRV